MTLMSKLHYLFQLTISIALILLRKKTQLWLLIYTKLISVWKVLLLYLKVQVIKLTQVLLTYIKHQLNTLMFYVKSKHKSALLNLVFLMERAQELLIYQTMLIYQILLQLDQNGLDTPAMNNSFTNWWKMVWVGKNALQISLLS